MTLAEPRSAPAERLELVLRRIARQLDLSAMVVGDRNGLPIASFSRADHSLAATAMATMILYAAENVAANLGLVGQEDVLVEGRGWKVLVRALGDGFTLLAVMEGEVNLGLLRLEIARAIPQLKELLGAMG